MVLRIVGGSSKGRKLKGPQGLEFRPTTARAKTFIFSYLFDEVLEACVLDLFAGTGSLGLEALSRGAGHVDFVERSAGHIQLLKSNLSLCGFEDRAQIIRGDVFEEIRRLGRLKRRYDLIFADPPFKALWREKIIRTVEDSQILESHGKLLVEHESHDPDRGPHRLRMIRQKHMGQSVVSIYDEESI